MEQTGTEPGDEVNEEGCPVVCPLPCGKPVVSCTRDHKCESPCGHDRTETCPGDTATGTAGCLTVLRLSCSCGAVSNTPLPCGSVDALGFVVVATGVGVSRRFEVTVDCTRSIHVACLVGNRRRIVLSAFKVGNRLGTKGQIMTQAGAGVDMLVFVDIPQDMGRGVMAGYIRGVIQQHSQQQQQQHKFDFLQPFTVPFQLAVEWARANWFDGENATFEQSDTTNCPRKDRKRKRIPNCRDHVIQFETVLDLRVVVALIAGREDVVAPVSSGVVLGARREGADGGAVYADLEEEEREHDNVEADVVEDNLVVVPGMVMKNEFDPETANAYKILVGPSASEGGENLAKAEEGDGGGVEETGDDDVQEGLDAGGEGAGDAVKGEGDGEGVEEEGASKKGKKKKKKKKKTADGEDLEQVEEKIEKAVAKIERLPEVHSTRCAEILRDKQRNAHKQETLRILAYKDKLDSPTSSSAARKPAVAGGGNVAKMAAKDKEDARKRLRERIEKARPGGGGKDAGKGGKGKGKK